MIKSSLYHHKLFEKVFQFIIILSSLHCAICQFDECNRQDQNYHCIGQIGQSIFASTNTTSPNNCIYEKTCQFYIVIEDASSTEQNWKFYIQKTNLGNEYDVKFVIYSCKNFDGEKVTQARPNDLAIFFTWNSESGRTMHYEVANEEIPSVLVEKYFNIILRKEEDEDNLFFINMKTNRRFISSFYSIDLHEDICFDLNVNLSSNKTYEGKNHVVSSLPWQNPKITYIKTIYDGNCFNHIFACWCLRGNNDSGLIQHETMQREFKPGDCLYVIRIAKLPEHLEFSIFQLDDKTKSIELRIQEPDSHDQDFGVGFFLAYDKNSKVLNCHPSRFFEYAVDNTTYGDAWVTDYRKYVIDKKDKKSPHIHRYCRFKSLLTVKSIIHSMDLTTNLPIDIKVDNTILDGQIKLPIDLKVGTEDLGELPTKPTKTRTTIKTTTSSPVETKPGDTTGTTLSTISTSEEPTEEPPEEDTEPPEEDTEPPEENTDQPDDHGDCIKPKALSWLIVTMLLSHIIV